MQTCNEFLAAFKAGVNPITGKPNLWRELSDQMIWDAAQKAYADEYRSLAIEEKRTMDKVKFPTSEDVLCAIARGWCHPKNQYRVIDTNLANAIHAEIMDLFADQTDATEERRALEVMDAQDQMQEMRKVDK